MWFRGGRRRALAAWLMVVACALAAAGAAFAAPAGDVGTPGPETGPVGSELTSSKPQSKLWFNAGGWWGSLFDPASKHFHIFHLDRATETWTDTGVVADPTPNTRADTLWDQAAGKLYIASHKLSPAAETTHQPDIPNPPPSTRPGELWRYSYEPAANAYALDPGFPVDIVGVDVEALVIAKEAGAHGRVWATWTSGDRIWVRHTTTDDAHWSPAYVLPAALGATTLTPDDVASVIAFDDPADGGHQIGVMWSNQVDGRFYFATHADGSGDAGSDWHVEAVPYSEFSDDHIHLATDSTGALYAVVKSGATAADAPAVSLLVRTPAGAWSEHTAWLVKDHPTRPTMLIDEQRGIVHLFATGPLPDDPANIDGMLWQKSAPIAAPAFAGGPGEPLMRDATQGGEVHDATSTKQNVDAASGIVVLGSDEIAGRYWSSDSAAGAPAAPAPSTPVLSGATTDALPSAPGPPAAILRAPALRRLLLASRQHGRVVRGSLYAGVAGSNVRISLRLVGAHGHAGVPAGMITRHVPAAGVIRFAVALRGRARAIAARRRTVALVVRVSVTPPAGPRVARVRRVTLRA